MKILVLILLFVVGVYADDTNAVSTAPRVRLPQGGYATVQLPDDVIVWDKDTIETNVPASTKSVSFVFHFKNISKETVKILTVRESCGCIKMELPPPVLRAADESQIGVTVKLPGIHRDWTNTQTVTVETDKGTKVLKIEIKT